MPVSDGVKRRLLVITGGVCYYCGKKLYLKKKGSREVVTIDHYVPLSKGGFDDVSNRVPACKKCNNAKADLMPEEFLEKLNGTKD